MVWCSVLWLFMWYYVSIYVVYCMVYHRYIIGIIIVILCDIWAYNVWYIMYVYCKLYVMYYVIYNVYYIVYYCGFMCSCLMVLCRCIVLCWYNFILYLGMWSCLLLCVQIVLFRPDFCYMSVIQFCVTIVYYSVVVDYPIFTAVFGYKVECISLICYIFVV